MSNFMKREADFTMTDKLLAMFTYARIHGVRLDQASTALGYDRDTLFEAVAYRYAISDTGKEYIQDYGRTIAEGCRRLASAS